ncbi:helix-turn-helix transcriptional regulator [Pseudoalteromonas sp. SG44-1]|uniref:helix-turn-helix domain-containing protein n=1 Tax=Pseudoalteromonas sp. SG44-1 TaxID=2760964 RepID=UPI002873DD18|nr:helix-turn-helix transcriptional regulator [Pseudoalteromonas sp. SG44-1]
MTINPVPGRIKQARVSKGISQKELGIRIGLDQSSASSRMNHYEKGRHTPDIPTLKRVADELGVPLPYFLCESEKTAELICLIEDLPEVEKNILIQKLKKNNNRLPNDV